MKWETTITIKIISIKKHIPPIIDLTSLFPSRVSSGDVLNKSSFFTIEIAGFYYLICRSGSYNC